jgi:hypothetical protein
VAHVKVRNRGQVVHRSTHAVHVLAVFKVWVDQQQSAPGGHEDHHLQSSSVPEGLLPAGAPRQGVQDSMNKGLLHSRGEVWLI